MDILRKREWAGILAEYPLLRVLLFERWFRLGLFVFLAILIGGALLLPKIWVTSPKGVHPIVRVSWLDRLQAWSLKRSALKSEQAGAHDRAYHSWLSAVANNRADRAAIRGLLGSYLAHEEATMHPGYMVPQALWLLQLTQTNQVELELAVKVLEKRKAYDMVTTLLNPTNQTLSVELEQALLRALFNGGNYRGFDSRWRSVSAAAQADQEIRLLRAASQAGWGTPTEAVDGQAVLEQALQDPQWRTQAARLGLLISALRDDPDDYARRLDRLTEWRADELLMHITYWKLLIRAARVKEAMGLAEVHPRAPANATELVELARVFSLGGQSDKAIAILERYHQEFGYAPAFWITYAVELASRRQWSTLRELSVRMRNRPDVGDALSGLSFFLEGWSEHAQGRLSHADAALERLRDRGIGIPEVAIRAAQELVARGYPAVARDVLTKVEESIFNDPRYWITLFSAAAALHDAPLMVKAARRTYELDPRDNVSLNNFAASLLIQRTDGQEAIRLTLELLARNPHSPVSMINHAGALLLNERAAEADALLKRVRTNGFSRAQMTVYHLDRFECDFRLGRFETAWSYVDRIQDEFLYPAQREWLSQARSKLPPRPETSEAAAAPATSQPGNVKPSAGG